MTEESVSLKTVPMGIVIVSAEAAAVLHPSDVSEALWRYSQGDWGNLETEMWAMHDEALEAGMELCVCYQDRNKNYFYIATDSDRAETIVYLGEEP